jgi:hypothetical protein
LSIFVHIVSVYIIKKYTKKILAKKYTKKMRAKHIPPFSCSTNYNVHTGTLVKLLKPTPVTGTISMATNVIDGISIVN